MSLPFRRRCSYLRRSQTIGLQAKLQLGFDNQIAGNRIFKVPVFKISRGQSFIHPIEYHFLRTLCMNNTSPPPT